MSIENITAKYYGHSHRLEIQKSLPVSWLLWQSSSAAGNRGRKGAIAYGVVKGAVPQFTRALAREMADCSVNCASPGIIRTRFQDYLTAEQVPNNTENRIPLRREGRPEKMFLSLSESSEPAMP